MVPACSRAQHKSLLALHASSSISPSLGAELHSQWQLRRRHESKTGFTPPPTLPCLHSSTLTQVTALLSLPGHRGNHSLHEPSAKEGTDLHNWGTGDIAVLSCIVGLLSECQPNPRSLSQQTKFITLLSNPKKA